MHAFRRSTLRSALSAARAIAPRASPSMAIAQLTRSSAVNARSSVVVAARHFSQSISFSKDGADETPVSQSENPVANAAGPETEFGVFVRNLVFDTNEEHLSDLFSPYGPIEHLVLARDARGLSRGYGFIYYKDMESAQSAIAATNGVFYQGRRIQTQMRAARMPKSRQTRSQNQPTRTVYIGNIPYETSDAELNRLFKDLDNVKDVRVAVDRTTGWPRGFAHADFVDVESAQNAYEKLRGTVLGGRELRIDYADDAKGDKQN